MISDSGLRLAEKTHEPRRVEGLGYQKLSQMRSFSIGHRHLPGVREGRRRLLLLVAYAVAVLSLTPIWYLGIGYPDIVTGCSARSQGNESVVVNM
jgi:hypothetical protein